MIIDYEVLKGNKRVSLIFSKVTVCNKETVRSIKLQIYRVFEGYKSHAQNDVNICSLAVDFLKKKKTNCRFFRAFSN